MDNHPIKDRTIILLTLSACARVTVLIFVCVCVCVCVTYDSGGSTDLQCDGKLSLKTQILRIGSFDSETAV